MQIDSVRRLWTIMPLGRSRFNTLGLPPAMLADQMIAVRGSWLTVLRCAKASRTHEAIKPAQFDAAS